MFKAIILLAEFVMWCFLGMSLPFKALHPLVNYVIIIAWVLIGFLRSQYSLSRYHFYSTGRNTRMHRVILGIVAFVLVRLVAGQVHRF